MMNKLSYNKKGMHLAYKVLTIVISVICIILLLVVYYRSGSVLIDSNNVYKNVPTIATNFQGEYNSFMKNSVNNEQIFSLQGPQNWYIIFFESKTKPNLCRDYKTCVCICSSNDASYCDQDSQGYCLEIKNFTGDISYQMKKIPFGIKIRKDSGIASLVGNCDQAGVC